jgi:hypothetical protein
MVLKITKVNKKEGGLKVYEYDHGKYYDNYKEKRGRTTCPICFSEVSNIYFEKHKTSSKCKKLAEPQLNLSKEHEEEKQRLLEQLDTILKILHDKFGYKK